MTGPDPRERPPGLAAPTGREISEASTDPGRASIFEEERRRLKRRLELQELLQDFSSKMRSQRDVESIARVLTEAVAELTSFRNAILTVLDPDGRTLRGVSVSGHRRTFEIGTRLSKYSVTRICIDVNDHPTYSRALKDGQMIVHRSKEDIVNTLANLTGINPGILEIIRRTTRMNFALTVPIFLGDPGTSMMPLGVLGVSSIKTEADPEDVRFVRILADQAALALHNVRLIEDLKRQAVRAESSEARIRNIIDSAHDMIVSYDPSGNVNYANRTFQGSPLYSMEGELLDTDTLERVHPDDQPALVEAYIALKEAVPIRGVEYRIRPRDGVYHHHNLNAATVVDRKGEVREIVAFIRDVTQEKYRERQIVRRNKELEVLNALITNLTSPLPFAEMIERSLAIIAEFTGADMISLWSKTGLGVPSIRMMGHLWVPQEVLDFLAQALPKIPETDLFSLDKVVVMDDVSDLPPQYFSLLTKHDVEAVVSVPVATKGVVTGYVIGGATSPMALDDEDMAILRAVGDQLGMVLDISKLLQDNGDPADDAE